MTIKSICKVLAISILVSLSFLNGVLSNVATASTKKNKKILKVLNNGEPSTLDPHLEYGDWETNITRNMFWGLYVYDGKSKLVPGLAKDYYVNSDGTKYTFELKHLKWSDGKPITASDVVFSIRRSLSPELASKYASMLFPIKNAKEYNQGKVSKEKLGVKAINDHTVQFVLESSTPYFLSLTATFPAKTLPKHTIEKYKKSWTNPKNIVVSGPYILKYWSPNDKIIIEKRDDFYNAKSVKIDKIIFYPVSEATTAQKQYLTGEYDWNFLVDKSKVKRLKKKLGSEVKSMAIFVTYYYVANNNNPNLKSVKVRQALAMAINRELIAHKIMKDSYLPAKSWIPSGMLNYLPANEQPKMKWMKLPFDQRVKMAKKYLKEEGFNKDHPLTLTISYNSDESHRKIAVAIADYWKRIGVKTSLYNTDSHTHYASLASGDYSIGRGSWDASYNDPMAMLFIFGSKSQKNYANYKSAEVDRLLKQADKEVSLKQRAKVLAKVEQKILNDVPYIPLFYHTTYELVSKKITGWHANPLAIHPMWIIDINR